MIRDAFLIKPVRKNVLLNLYALNTGLGDSADIYRELSKGYIEEGDASLGVKYAFDALKLKSEPEAYLNLAEILKKYKLFRHARKVLEQGLSEFPDSSEVKNELNELRRFPGQS